MFFMFFIFAWKTFSFRFFWWDDHFGAQWSLHIYRIVAHCGLLVCGNWHFPSFCKQVVLLGQAVVEEVHKNSKNQQHKDLNYKKTINTSSPSITYFKKTLAKTPSNDFQKLRNRSSRLYEWTIKFIQISFFSVELSSKHLFKVNSSFESKPG